MNRFKTRLLAGDLQIGLWLSLASPYTAELCAGAGFDWLAIDGEHGPNDLRSIMAQLQVLHGSPSQPVVRPVAGEAWMIKQLLDIGARTLLIPMVETPEQARALVAAVRYPPAGIRGVGAAVARASGFDRQPDYLVTADAEICLLVQIETRLGLENIESIAAIEGIDGLFIGPADLSASLGHLGNPTAPEAQAAIADGLRRIVATGKAAGILLSDETLVRGAIALGARFVAVGSDVGLLARGADRLAARYERATPNQGGGIY